MSRVRRFCQFIARQPSSWVLIALCGVLLAFCPRSSPRGGRKITIARDTTYLVEPLRPDGYVDYRAALNAMSSQGVTPENNAAVLLWKAAGPSHFPSGDVHQYFKLLGIDPPPASGSYFVPVATFRVKPPPATLPPSGLDPNDPDNQLGEAQQRPWTQQEFPAVAAWLQANSVPLRLALQASSRPRYYSPIGESSDTSLINALICLLSTERELVYLLEADATLRIGAGKLEDAWLDALACHRLARLVAQGPTLFDELTAMTIDGIAMNTDCIILGSGHPTAEQVGRFRRQFDALPRLAPIADKLRTGERYYCLDMMADLAKSNGSLASVGRYTNGTLSAVPRWTPDAHVEWDTTLRMMNSWTDRLANVATIADPAEQRAARAAFSADVQRLKSEVAEFKLDPLECSDSVASEVAEKLLVIWSIPGDLAAFNAENRQLNRQNMCRLAFALTAYRIDHGQYPPALSALAPHYIDAVPTDRFTGLDLHYRLEPNSYVLYGSNNDGEDPPLDDPTADPLLDPVGCAGLRVPPKAGN